MKDTLNILNRMRERHFILHPLAQAVYINWCLYAEDNTEYVPINCAGMGKVKRRGIITSTEYFKNGHEQIFSNQGILF